MRSCANKVVAGVRCGTLLPNIRPQDTRQFATAQQICQLEGLAVAIPWEFASPLPHHSTRPLRGLARGWPVHAGTSSGASSERSHSTRREAPRSWQASREAAAESSGAPSERSHSTSPTLLLSRLFRSRSRCHVPVDDGIVVECRGSTYCGAATIPFTSVTRQISIRESRGTGAAWRATTLQRDCLLIWSTPKNFPRSTTPARVSVSSNGGALRRKRR